MAAELPDVLDLLRVAVDAGLPAVAGAGRGRAPPSGPPRPAELRAAAARTQAGQPRAEALALLRGALPDARAWRRSSRRSAAPSAMARRSDRPWPRWRRTPARSRPSASAITPRARRRSIQLAVALLLVPAVMLLVAAALVAGLT